MANLIERKCVVATSSVVEALQLATEVVNEHTLDLRLERHSNGFRIIASEYPIDTPRQKRYTASERRQFEIKRLRERLAHVNLEARQLDARLAELERLESEDKSEG